MRRILGVGAVVLGMLGVLLCAAAVAVGWWAASRTLERVDGVFARLDHRLSETDAGLNRVESRMNAVRSGISKVRDAAQTLETENLDLSAARARIEQLVESLITSLDRATTIADSLRLVASGLRTAGDIVDQLNGEVEATVRVRSAADTLDDAAQALGNLQARLEAAKSVKAIQSVHELVNLAREAVASSERLADGLATVRREINVFRGHTAEWRGTIQGWVYVAAIAHTFLWLWAGLGQLCLIAWGRARRAKPT